MNVFNWFTFLFKRKEEATEVVESYNNKVCMKLENPEGTFKVFEEEQEKLEIVDERKVKTPLDTIKVVDEEGDPAMSAILNAAFNGKGAVIGNVDEDGKLTIRDSD